MSTVHALPKRPVPIRGEIPATRRTGLHPDFWYPLARSRDLRSGKTLPVQFAGEPIVIARMADGTVFALENRCAHRQVPLHLGVVKGDRLLCGYHCWAYDRSGHCINVPYLDEQQTLPNGVKAYACREAYGFLWVFPGNQALADSVPLPEIPTYSNPRFKTRVLDRKIDCHYSFMHENLMDMNHQFLHRSLMGSIRPTLLDLREGQGEDANWVEVDYTFSRASGKQTLGETFILNRKQLKPGEASHDLMTIRTEYPYQTLKFWTAGSETPALDLFNVYMPVDAAQRSNQTYGLMMIQKPGIPGVMNLLWPFIIWFTEGIFGQDREIVEAEQRAYEMQGGDENQEIFPAIQKLKELLARRGVPINPAS